MSLDTSLKALGVIRTKAVDCKNKSRASVHYIRSSSSKAPYLGLNILNYEDRTRVRVCVSLSVFDNILCGSTAPNTTKR